MKGGEKERTGGKEGRPINERIGRSPNTEGHTFNANRRARRRVCEGARTDEAKVRKKEAKGDIQRKQEGKEPESEMDPAAQLNRSHAQ